jgi:hypothetical protein
MAFPASPTNGQTAVVNNVTYTYNSTSNSWRRTVGGSVATSSIQEFTATASQTTFAISGGYTVGQIQVYANGVQLNSADYTATDGANVVVSAPRRANDIIRVIAVQSAIISSQQAYNFTEVTATLAQQSSFTASYNTSTVQVFKDGTLISPGNYTATSGTAIVLSTATASTVVNGTKIGIISFNSVSISSALSTNGGTVTGVLNVNGSLRQGGVDVKAFSIAAAVALGS